MKNSHSRIKVCVLFSISFIYIFGPQSVQCQENSYLILNNEFGIKYESMSQKLIINVNIKYQERLIDNIYNSGYFFKGILEKRFTLSSGLSVEELPVAGFCSLSSIEFGEEQSYVAAKTDNRNMLNKKTYFSGTWDNTNKTYCGRWTLPGDGFEITENACLINATTIFSFSSLLAQQLKEALLYIVTQPEVDIFFEYSDDLKNFTNKFEAAQVGYDFGKYLITPSYWKSGPQRIVKLVPSTLRTRAFQRSANNLAKSLNSAVILLNTIFSTTDVLNQIIEAVLICTSANVKAKERLQIIKNCAINQHNYELMNACDLVLRELDEFNDNIIDGIKFEIQNNGIENIKNASNFYLFYKLITNAKYFATTTAGVITICYLYADNTIDMILLQTGKSFEKPFAAMNIGKTLSDYLNAKEISTNIGDDDKYEIIEIYKCFLYSLYYASDNASKVLEGNYFFEAADIIQYLISGKPSRVKQSREDLKKLAIQLKNEFIAYIPPYNNINQKLIEINSKIRN